MNRAILLYLLFAVAAFFLATTGSDLFARVTIGHQSFAEALSEHLYWARLEIAGTLMLLLPFGFLAVIGSWIEKRTSRLMGLIIFSLPTLFLMFSYFEGYQASKVAELGHRWTAAAVSIGFLPFSAAAVVLLTWLVGFALICLRRKNAEQD